MRIAAEVKAGNIAGVIGAMQGQRHAEQKTNKTLNPKMRTLSDLTSSGSHEMMMPPP